MTRRSNGEILPNALVGNRPKAQKTNRFKAFTCRVERSQLYSAIVSPISRPSEPERSAEAIERYRVRARYLAGLAGTGAAALAAGLVFGSAASSLPHEARAAGLLAVSLLLLSVSMFAVAQTITGADKITKADRQKNAATKTLYLIRQTTFLGSSAAAGAILSLVAMLAFLMSDASLEKSEGTFIVSANGLNKAKQACPELKNPIRGLVPPRTLDLQPAFVSIELMDVRCSKLGAHRAHLTIEMGELIAWSFSG